MRNTKAEARSEKQELRCLVGNLPSLPVAFRLPPSGRRSRRGFTLTELLVVIGIIGVLLGILIPATAAARYRARMVQCSSNLRGIGQGVMQYAADNGGYYPPRCLNGDAKAALLYYPGQASTDQRVLLGAYINFTRVACPFAPKSLDYMNYNGTTDDIEWTYSMWDGFQYINTIPPEKGAFRVGKPFTYKGKSFNVLAGDSQWEAINGIDSTGNGCVSEGEHPATGEDSLTGVPGSGAYFTRWNNTTGRVRGAVDLNFLFNDGSVSTITRVGFNYWLPTDPNYRTDVVAIPVWANNTTNSWSIAMPAGH